MPLTYCRHWCRYNNDAMEEEQQEEVQSDLKELRMRGFYVEKKDCKKYGMMIEAAPKRIEEGQ